MTDKAREFATNLWKRGTEVAKQQARILVLQSEVHRLRDRKRELFYQMGEKVYALFEKELVKNEDLLAFCQQAREIDTEIASRELEMEQVRRGEEPAPEAETTASEAPDTAPTAPPWPAAGFPPEPQSPAPESVFPGGPPPVAEGETPPEAEASDTPPPGSPGSRESPGR